MVSEYLELETRIFETVERVKCLGKEQCTKYINEYKKERPEMLTLPHQFRSCSIRTAELNVARIHSKTQPKRLPQFKYIRRVHQHLDHKLCRR
jgi:hypothetical protein